MRKTLVAILMVACALAVAAAAALWRKAEAVAQENKGLNERIAELEESLEVVRDESRQASRATPEAEAQKRELLRLRNDVTQLRANEQNLIRIEAENQQLAAENRRLQKQAFTRAKQPAEEFPMMRYGAVQGVNTPKPAEPGAADPLAFYRKNPELMRRYFPHLVATNAPVQR